mmetsp:Transcript_12048/g.33358  ORF Transcript_12048/g.33358 Transcript_12048/m.33358 type:complete len:222 (-) Transcript_12048:155-820(-)
MSTPSWSTEYPTRHHTGSAMESNPKYLARASGIRQPTAPSMAHLAWSSSASKNFPSLEPAYAPFLHSLSPGPPLSSLLSPSGSKPESPGRVPVKWSAPGFRSKALPEPKYPFSRGSVSLILTLSLSSRFASGSRSFFSSSTLFAMLSPTSVLDMAVKPTTGSAERSTTCAVFGLNWEARPATTKPATRYVDGFATTFAKLLANDSARSSSSSFELGPALDP